MPFFEILIYHNEVCTNVCYRLDIVRSLITKQYIARLRRNGKLVYTASNSDVNSLYKRLEKDIDIDI